ncbi:MAG TPA: TetR/AcrR family transcriptional regulator [Prosthecochloris aestuarii]|uniref:TetR/AcrR family transcriptional regulator n=1 Tax=Prosthecochloris aestuarii TaxID=1102 RepID=A0A831SN30_PROAE|nr:TetR/AcrR family transcriptional regulator [Prosthecochloris sp.]HED30666.1 TetR/AcrR family transcriptional regulator [Prosthecochloris aestuarii]
MARPLKNRQLSHPHDVIKDAAWQQISQSGAGSLSLRKIARDIGITAPAIYNYYPDRNALVTALIIDAFTSFGNSQLSARNSRPGPGKEIERLEATGIAYREWALEHPQQYHLIFGTPVPGYIPPMQEILPVLLHSLTALTSCITELHQQGKIDLEDVPRPLVDRNNRFYGMVQPANDIQLAIYGIAMNIWGRVHGLVSLEITGQLPPFGQDGAALYHYELTSIIRQFITKQATKRENDT